METKIKVAQARVNGDWYNIKTQDGKEVSIMMSKNPKLKSAIDEASVRGDINFDLDVNLVEKNAKLYGWDIQEKKQSGFKGQPKDEGIITMLSCISSACIAVQQSSNHTNTELILQMANKFYDAAKQKSTLKNQL